MEEDSIEMHYIRGYPALASFIASDSDHSTAIYRRFDRLSARNLLYLQSDLIQLESAQDALDAEDAHKTANSDHTMIWQELKDRAMLPEGLDERRRLDLALEIRQKIREYSESTESARQWIAPESMDTKGKPSYWRARCFP